ncbi:MAG: phenylacetate--CoA ligase family protein [Acidimicrobiales bacterium]
MVRPSGGRPFPMTSRWDGRAAAAAFRLAVGSPLVGAWLDRLQVMSQWSQSDVEGWQRQHAQAALNRARRRLSAYRDNPDYRVARWEDLPVLTKDDVRHRPAAFSDRRVAGRKVTTGGTGGRPLAVKVATSSFFIEWAHIAYAWRSAGVGLVDPKITFRGSSLGRGFSDRPVFFQPTYNQLAVSPFHLTGSTFETLLAQLGHFRPVALWGYPSAITPFARWVERTGPHPALSSLRAVLLASEGAFAWQLELFRRAFDAQVVRWYGQSEKAVFASGCPTSDGYHVLPTYGLAEIVGGRVIGTGFTNGAMPLIRYDTEDRARIGQPTCSCGLPFPWLVDIEGRWDQALLWGRSGEPISTSALNFHDPVFANFDRFQFRQGEPGRVTLLVTEPTDDHCPPEVLESARRSLQERVGEALVIDVELCGHEDLLTRRGKVVTVDQRCTTTDAEIT